MDENTLVTHKHLSSLGIGVVSRKLKRSVEVKFGENAQYKFKPDELKPVDISQCKTITNHEWRKQPFRVSLKIKYVIVRNHLHRFNGVGWIYERSITSDDLMRYQVVI